MKQYPYLRFCIGILTFLFKTLNKTASDEEVRSPRMKIRLLRGISVLLFTCGFV
jgi:hypothetical protein